MEEAIDFVLNNNVAIVLLVLAVLTAVKQFLGKIEALDTPAWLSGTVTVLKKIAEYLTANDGETD